MVSKPQIHANCSFRIPSAARIAVSLEEGNASEGTSTPSCLASLSTTLMPLITLGSGGGGLADLCRRLHWGPDMFVAGALSASFLWQQLGGS